MPKKPPPRKITWEEFRAFSKNLNRKQAAELYKLDPAAIGQWVSRNNAPKNEKQTGYDLSALICWREDFHKGKTAQVGETGETNKARHERLRADNEQIKKDSGAIELAVLRDEYVSAEGSARAMADVILTAREYLLSLPVRLAALVRPDSPGAAKVIIEKEIRYVLEAMATGSKNADRKKEKKGN